MRLYKSCLRITKMGEGRRHVEILKFYLNNKLSMGKIAGLKDRSPATVKNQLDKHNEAIKSVGFCSVCKRAGGQFYKDLATRLS